MSIFTSDFSQSGEAGVLVSATVKRTGLAGRFHERDDVGALAGLRDRQHRRLAERQLDAIDRGQRRPEREATALARGQFDRIFEEQRGMIGGTARNRCRGRRDPCLPAPRRRASATLRRRPAGERRPRGFRRSRDARGSWLIVILSVRAFPAASLLAYHPDRPARSWRASVRPRSHRHPPGRASG